MHKLAMPLRNKINDMASLLCAQHVSRNCWASLIAERFGDEIAAAGIAKSSHQAIVRLIIDGRW